MGILMKGIDVAAAMKEELIKEAGLLKEGGIIPCLAIIRVGSRKDDLSYERGAKKRMDMIGIECRVMELPEDISQKEFEEVFRKVNDDTSVHGILLFRPLLKHLDEEPVRRMIHPLKDVDCMSDVNLLKVFDGDGTGYAPCTAEAVMKMLKHYNIDLKGKNTTVVGRSMVVGKPLSMLLLKENATVTICHTKTENLAKICKNADVLVAAAGKAKMITADMVGDGAVVVDVGINVDEEGNLCGDVDFEGAEQKSSYISPVPKGVGSLTTSVLAEHVIRAAKELSQSSTDR
ncbi:MAG: bifunctional 5,10-methylenetetrahydrofolate dehydrogenase/5,10-methenyltetrahydrofolate cyclohydrolase [Dorea sp.]|jgi:methylenetetrahydrofolate dehydrogenase (NADP+)/methenyltetrahydrofolate cyclohydrolase|nr:bifunctional 5,10-methylenetetrahydrofolate dehydrogenase/5,10-methenyltetrahydrofolate cyclohydrolase [Dorea sp.]